MEDENVKLAYPKHLGITKHDVEKQRTGFRFAERWLLSEDAKNYYLSFKR